MINLLRVARKELLSVLRERRVVFTTLVLPILLMPVLMYGPLIFFGSVSQKTADAVQQIGVQNLPEGALSALRAVKLEPIPADNPEKAVQDKNLQAAVTYKDNVFTVFGRLSGGATQSSLVVEKVKTALGAYKERLVAERLKAKGLSTEILEPVKIAVQDASPKQERAAGLFAFLIPYFLVIFILTGGQVVAIDATAGEKEKGTLEALLAAPVPLAQIVGGKAIATLSVALVSALAAVTGILIGSTVVRSFFTDQLKSQTSSAALGGGLALEPSGYLAILLTSVLFAAFMVSIQLSLGLYARSFKEAQSYMTPLQIVFIVPLLLLQFSDFMALQSWFYLVPGLNVMLLLDGLVRGSAVSWQLAFTWLSTLGYALLALMLAVRSFTREEVVFRN